MKVKYDEKLFILAVQIKISAVARARHHSIEI